MEMEQLIWFPPSTNCIALAFCNHKLILHSPPHSVSIELKKLKYILGPLSEFGLLLSS